MSPQLELNLPGRGSRRPLRSGHAPEPLWRRALVWAPAWLPLVLLLQVAAFGLAPAWAEKERLDRAEAEVSSREAHLTAELERLLEDRRKLSDPIYRERVRRSLRDLERTPLTLESTRRRDP